MAKPKYKERNFIFLPKLFYLLLFSIPFNLTQAQESAWGIISYESSTPYFTYLKQEKKRRILSYAEAQIPIYQVIYVKYNLSKESFLKNVCLTPNFSKTLSWSHLMMQRAEKEALKRNYFLSETLLDSIKTLYPYYPYLFYTYIILAKKKGEERLIKNIVPIFESFAQYMSHKEIAQTYYQLYMFYRDKHPTLISNIQKKIDYLQKSQKFSPTKEKEKILLLLQKTLLKG